MNLGQIRTATQELLGDLREHTWGPTMVNDAINWACQAYTEKKEATYKEETATADASGVVPLPADILILRRVVHATDGVLLPSTVEAEDAKHPTWRSDSKGVGERFVKWVPWNGMAVKVIPYAADSFTLGFLEAPTTLTADADLVDTRIPVAHHRHLRYAAAAWLLMNDSQEEDAQKATAYLQIFNSLIGFQE